MPWKSKMTRRASLFLCRGSFLLLVLAVLGGYGLKAVPASAAKKITTVSSPILEVKIQDNIAKPITPAPAPAVTLDPFFIVLEEGSRVRVRRVQVSLEFSQPEMLPKFDPQSPALREMLYDFLLDKEQANSGREEKKQEQVLTQLVNRCLGQEAVSAVKVDQSFLLLR